MSKDIKNKARQGTPNQDQDTGEPTWRDPASLPDERVTEAEEPADEPAKVPPQQGKPE